MEEFKFYNLLLNFDEFLSKIEYDIRLFKLLLGFEVRNVKIFNLIVVFLLIFILY